MPSTWFRKISALIGVVGLIGGAYWIGTKQTTADDPRSASKSGGRPASAAPAGPPPTVVEAARVSETSLSESIVTVGSLKSDESVVIRPEVSGRIAEILFLEGQRVALGEPLVRLDASVPQAELAQAQASLTLIRSRLERARDLYQRGFLSNQASDEAESNFKVAQAAHDLVSARLTKLTIKAPFSGIVGLRQVSVGDFIREGQDIANLEAIEALKVDFRVPEIAVSQITTGQTLQLTMDALPGHTFAGRIFAINPLLDANGRSIVIRARVNNIDTKLRPGMFARVRILTDAKKDALTIPEQALIASGDDFFVFRVTDGRALRTKVELGQRRAGIVEVVRGVSREDVVVIAGQFKIRDGAAVKVTAAAPTAVVPTPKSAAARG